jgi:hypothetical protein
MTVFDARQRPARTLSIGRKLSRFSGETQLVGGAAVTKVPRVSAIRLGGDCGSCCGRSHGNSCSTRRPGIAMSLLPRSPHQSIRKVAILSPHHSANRECGDAEILGRSAEIYCPLSHRTNKDFDGSANFEVHWQDRKPASGTRKSSAPFHDLHHALAARLLSVETGSRRASRLSRVSWSIISFSSG